MKVSLEEAIHLLTNGQNVALPTETVYGLAASLAHPQAIQHIFTLKGRPAHNPLIMHVSHPEEAAHYVADLLPDFQKLAQTFWPGPLTLILPALCDAVPSIVRAGLPTVAIRIPSHPLSLEVLRQTGPIVMPSANLSGKPSATTPAHVEEDFGPDLPILDGGPCYNGVESTILGLEEGRWTILRRGALSAEQLSTSLSYQPTYTDSPSNTPQCPGQLLQHYAPKAKLILDERVDPSLIGVIVGFSDRSYPASCHLFALGTTDDPEAVAHHLYAILRQLDREGIQAAWVDMRFPRTHLWQTVDERLRRAAAFK